MANKTKKELSKMLKSDLIMLILTKNEEIACEKAYADVRVERLRLYFDLYKTFVSEKHFVDEDFFDFFEKGGRSFGE